VADKLRELIDLFERRVLSRTASGVHLQHFFDEEWNVCSDTYTYGHDIEAAWLLIEAAEVLEDEALVKRVQSAAVELARSVLAEGVDDHGALAYEGRQGAIIDPNRDWWCQAEAVVGFWRAYSLTNDTAFADASGGVFEFIRRSVVDEDDGEWFWRIRSDGSVDPREPKVSAWKGPYHNTRMCLEMLRRLGEER
jgi:mannobiose 2-epimerase